MELYSAKEIQKKAKVTKRQLIHWVEVGAIIPHQEDKRRGGKRLFNQQNLVEAIICRELNYHRLPTSLFVYVLNMLRRKFYQEDFFRDIPEWHSIAPYEHLRGVEGYFNFWDFPHAEIPYLIIRRPIAKRTAHGSVIKPRLFHADDGDSLEVFLEGSEDFKLMVALSKSCIVLSLDELVKEAGGMP